ncbi:MAG: fimbrillin family protein [Bacteroidales bacterium]
MRKNLLALATFSGILFASCSNEMDQMAEQQKEQNVIGFSTYSMMSKGAPITGNNTTIPEGGAWHDPGNFLFQGRSFHVAAYISTNTDDKKYMDAGIKFEGGSTGYGWNYMNPLDKAYWPTKEEKLNFYAVQPYNDFFHPTESSRKGTVSWTNVSKQMSISYTVPQNVIAQEDLMYAIELDKFKPQEGGNVTLNFKHALNQIHFMGRTDSENLRVEIATNGIEVCNIKNSGTLTAISDEPTWAVNDTKNNYTIETVKSENVAAPVVINSTSTAISNPSNVLMLVPQVVAAWNLSPNASAQTNSYLKINCKIWVNNGGSDQDKVYLHGDASAPALMYVPFTGTSMNLMGKKITYTLIFGGGYTDEGQPILTPITFDTAVQDWVNASSDVPTQTK